MVSYTYVTLDDLSEPLGFSYALGINNLGQVVGQDAAGLDQIGYVYSGGLYSHLRTGYYPISINDTGQIVGLYLDSGRERGFLYSNGVYTTLPDNPLANNGDFAISGINDAGQIVGTYLGTYGAQAFLYTGGIYTNLPDNALATGGFISATGINNAGKIVGNYSDNNGGQHGFLYSGGVYTTLPDNPSATNGFSVAGINDADQIVGNYSDNNGGQHGFLYSNGVYTTLLDVPSGIRDLATGINNAGQVVGAYFVDNLDGTLSQHGFIATPTAVDHALSIDATHSVVSRVISELSFTTGSNTVDHTAGVIAFTDADLSDRPTASVVGQTVVYHDSHGHPLSLSPEQNFAFKAALEISGESTNTNNGSVDWLYSIPDHLIDFVGTGESVTVTSEVQIDDHHGGAVIQDVTVTLYGTNEGVPAQSFNGITRPALNFDDIGRIVLDAAASEFASLFGIKLLYAGLPVSTPYAPVAPQALTPSSITLTDLINEAKQEITDQENTNGFSSHPSHLTNNLTLVDEIAKAIAAQFGTLQSHYTIGSTTGDVTNGFINVTSELSGPKGFLDQCVALVQALDKNLGGTTSWHPSTQVDASGQIANIAAGSPIATFNGQNYDGDHAAIFLGAGLEKGVAGFFVLDQYNFPPASTGLTLYPDGTPLDVNTYEPAEIRFINTLDAAATHYFLIA